MFFIELFQNNLKTQFLGKKVFYYDKTESTNNDIWTLFKKGEKEGILVIANNQTKGKGRRKNIWRSNQSLDIVCSFLLKESLSYKNIGIYSLLIPVGIIEGIKKTIDITLNIKWPNDLVYKNKKIGGILIESKKYNKFIYLNIGFGINVNSEPTDFPQDICNSLNSLKNIFHDDIQREILLANILNSIEKLLNNKNKIVEKWTNLCNHINKEVVVSHQNKLINSIFKKVNNSGQAIVNYNENDIIINGPFLQI